MIPQDWVAEWQTGTYVRNIDAVGWMRSRPPEIKALLVRFPPSCLVRGTRPLYCPAPGTVGIVFSYLENGGVKVIQHPDANTRAACKADWLEVVGYWRGLTPDVVKEILGFTTV